VEEVTAQKGKRKGGKLEEGEVEPKVPLIRSLTNITFL